MSPAMRLHKRERGMMRRWGVNGYFDGSPHSCARAFTYRI